ncbi:hypothetical protein MJA45_15935 [Paenibacillus aurantius]|uniref:Uncharacterized protein n=1 Tax=Paenibacillus aurantius TaxID=2918900 RepID=A0AA96LBP9_9BACL|nr:hypothetical protein [Paenibacillus aurantius]WNQ09136.1 hypothetical protein MJA45_15935 [Paenibacillus aurantius]
MESPEHRAIFFHKLQSLAEKENAGLQAFDECVILQTNLTTTGGSTVVAILVRDGCGGAFCVLVNKKEGIL